MLNQNSIYLSDGANDGIRSGAEQLQDHLKTQTGQIYSTADLEKAIRGWIEECIESLSEDVMYHAAEGLDTHAFNRRGFKRQLDKLTPQTAEVIPLPAPPAIAV
jgi:hypothetical protein